MKKVLMTNPQHFDVVYAINAHMMGADGKLQKVDKALAQKQWSTLKKTYEDLGFEVHVLDGDPQHPDMVFTANQSFPFLSSLDQSPSVILSHMKSEFRKDEVQHFENYYRKAGYKIHALKSDFSFEGNGDALITGKSIWAGHGFRTDKSVYEEIRSITGFDIYPLELKNENFYHLDTCFSILRGAPENANSGPSVVAVVREAFTSQDFDLIKSKFHTVIEIALDEAIENFAANCHSPDGKNVILHPGSTKFVQELARLGFAALEVDTSELKKSGGSVFCMKMMHY